MTSKEIQRQKVAIRKLLKTIESLIAEQQFVDAKKSIQLAETHISSLPAAKDQHTFKTTLKNLAERADAIKSRRVLALKEMLIPALEQFSDELIRLNIQREDTRINKLIVDLGCIRYALRQQPLTEAKIEIEVNRLIETLTNAESDFKHDPTILGFFKGIAVAVVSIIGYCRHPFQKEKAHQAFVEKWSEKLGLESEAQTIYKTTQTNLGFFSDGNNGALEKFKAERDNAHIVAP